VPLEPPLPIAAAYLDLPARVEVTFDQQLEPDPALDVPNWTVVLAGIGRPVTAGAALGRVVTLALGPGVGANAVNHVTFDPPPFDVIRLGGPPAAGFAAFPIT